MPFLKCNPTKIRRSRVLENNANIQGLRHSIFSVPHDKYIGVWHKNKKQGKGKYLSRSGKIYEGDWDRNFRHGFGVSGFVQENNTIWLEYRGDWHNGCKSGWGELHYKDGSYYKGYFKNNLRCKYGQMWYADGGFYDGDWLQDKRHGKGMHVYPNADRYEGGWLKDLKSGKGRYYFLQSGQLQEGYWGNDIPICSKLIDIPYRQTCVHPTPYIIPTNKLIDADKLYSAYELAVALGFSSCLSVNSSDSM